MKSNNPLKEEVMGRVYSWGLFNSEEKPRGVPAVPCLKFVVGKVIRLYIADDLHVLESSIFYLEINEPIEVQPGEYEVFELEGGDLLFAGPGKFPSAVDKDDLKALAKAGVIRFI